MKIDLQIERLVLEGVDVTPTQREVLGSAFVSELSKLVEAGGLKQELANGVMVPSVKANEMRLVTPLDAVRTGEQIARAVYTGIGGDAEAKG